uniref:Uncharacterized protein n=1 Tax=Arundo donax TaxID=35708 RepID=A0A0A8ZT66_ARUDO
MDFLVPNQIRAFPSPFGYLYICVLHAANRIHSYNVRLGWSSLTRQIDGSCLEPHLLVPN